MDPKLLLQHERRSLGIGKQLHPRPLSTSLVRQPMSLDKLSIQAATDELIAQNQLNEPLVILMAVESDGNALDG